MVQQELIYQRYGSIEMRYEGCDTMAQHWVSGWEVRGCWFDELGVPFLTEGLFLGREMVGCRKS